jgi:hypothetical protein
MQPVIEPLPMQESWSLRHFCLTLIHGGEVRRRRVQGGLGRELRLKQKTCLDDIVDADK